MNVLIDSVQKIGEIVKEERKRQGMLQRDLADVSGVSLHFLSDLEKGKPTVELQKVLQVLAGLGIAVELKHTHP